jgi:hypothetical protein
MITPSFVLCSLPRCGSTTLNRAMNLVPGIWVDFEPVFDDMPPTIAAVVGRVDEILADHSGFKHVYRETGYPFRRVDEAPIEQMERERDLWLELNAAILNYPGLRVLFLRRRDAFQRVVSDLVAKATNEWGESTATPVREQEVKEYRIRQRARELPALDETRLRWYLQHGTDMERQLRRRITANPVHELWYEDLFGSTVALDLRIDRFKQIMGFLEVPVPQEVVESAQLQWLLRPAAKMNDASVLDRIPNYPALCRAYGGDAEPKDSADTAQPGTLSIRSATVLPLDGWRMRAVGRNRAAVRWRPERAAAVRVDIDEVDGTTAHDIQLNVPGGAVQMGREYTLRFSVRADCVRFVEFGVALAQSPWSNLGKFERLELTEDWQSIVRTFRATATAEAARVHFDLGGVAVGVELSDVVFYGAGS